MMQEVTQEQENLRQSVLAVLENYEGSLSPIEILAVTSFVVGQLIAAQDQFKWTVPQVMDVVNTNLILGNQATAGHLLALKPKGNC